jgi:hypothetical protein
LAVAASGWAVWAWRKGRIGGNERAATVALKYLAVLEADFRREDRDGNGIEEFWTGNLAEFFSFYPKGGPSSGWAGVADSAPEFLSALGKADPSRSDAEPYRGYWFVPLEVDEKGVPYRTGGRPLRAFSFGFCAYPARYGETGTWSFVINEGNTIFRRDTQGKVERSWWFPPEEKFR